MTGIVIGGGISGCKIVLVEAARISVGPRVDAVAVTILGVEQEGAGELVLQLEEQSVEVRIAVIGIIGNAVHGWIKRWSQSSDGVVQVVMFGQMASGAALIAHTGNPTMRQLVIGPERVVIGIGG